MKAENDPMVDPTAMNTTAESEAATSMEPTATPMQVDQPEGHERREGHAKRERSPEPAQASTTSEDPLMEELDEWLVEWQGEYPNRVPRAPGDCTFWDDRREVHFPQGYISGSGESSMDFLRRARDQGQFEGLHLVLPEMLLETVATPPVAGQTERLMRVAPNGLSILVLSHGYSRQALYEGMDGYQQNHQWRKGAVTIAYTEDDQIQLLAWDRGQLHGRRLRSKWVGYTLLYIPPLPPLREVRPKAAMMNYTEIQELWKDAAFTHPPTGRSDRWNHNWIEQGWMVRQHGGKRHRMFHPLHKNCPWSQKEMATTRTTIVFDSDGDRHVFHDEWHGPIQSPPCIRPGEAWKGWTLFRKKTNEERDSTKVPGEDQSAASAAAASADVVIATDVSGPPAERADLPPGDQRPVDPVALRRGETSESTTAGYGGRDHRQATPKERARSFFYDDSEDGWEQVG